MASRSIVAIGCALLLAGSAAVSAQPVYTGLPAPLQRVAFEQRLGESIDLSLPFVDERGRSVELGELVGDGRRWYDCPMLCSMTLNGLVSSLKALELTVGREFDVLAVSFDPRETPALAAAVRARAVESYHRDGSEPGWHFLTGSQESIDALTEAVGFEYTWDDEREEFAHAAGLVVLTPDGTISRYLLGIEYSPRDLRLALVESSRGNVGSLVDQALLYCYRYDPETGTYSAATMNLVRLGGALTVVLIVAFIVLMTRRERRATTALREPEHVA